MCILKINPSAGHDVGNRCYCIKVGDDDNNDDDDDYGDDSH